MIPGTDPEEFIDELERHAGARSRVFHTLGRDGLAAFSHPVTAYVAGPMRGYVDFNYPLFNAVAQHLRAKGWRIFNPAETDAEVQDLATAADFPLRIYMQRDLAEVAASDCVLVLPGWELSEGARIETRVATMLGIPVYELPSYELVGFPDVWHNPDYIMRPTDDRPVGIGGLMEFRQEYPAHFIPEPQTLPTGSEARKDIPITTGVLDYFPAAIAAVAAVSKAGNDKHNPGEPMHWARGKSMDQADCIARHLLERGGIDPETGQRHTAQLAWRALALLQVELEEAGEAPLARGASE